MAERDYGIVNKAPPFYHLSIRMETGDKDVPRERYTKDTYARLLELRNRTRARYAAEEYTDNEPRLPSPGETG